MRCRYSGQGFLQQGTTSSSFGTAALGGSPDFAQSPAPAGLLGGSALAFGAPGSDAFCGGAPSGGGFQPDLGAVGATGRPSQTPVLGPFQLGSPVQAEGLRGARFPGPNFPDDPWARPM